MSSSYLRQIKMGYLTCWLSNLRERFFFRRLKQRKENYPNYKNIEYENYKAMDFGRRFIEDEDLMYGADEDFLDKLRMMNRAEAIAIMRKLTHSIDCLPVLEDWTQKISSYIRKPNEADVFFRVEFLREHDYVLFIDIERIDSDDYLDDINKEKTIEQCTPR